jgi:uncharacterized repeat protein (TIGR02543 family)
MSQMFQMQGILVEQDSGDFLRFDFHSDGLNTRMFAASFVNGVPLARDNAVIAANNVAPLYMRVARSGDEWTQSYSLNGANWETGVSFSYPMTVTQVGVFVGNAPGTSSPPHTGYIDYFFNTAQPISPEDGDRNTIAMNVVGSGSVAIDPAKTHYDCGEVVTLTAVANPGWAFDGWSGDVSGMTNPVTVTMMESKSITATFLGDEAYVLSTDIIGSGIVARDPDQASYYYGDVVTLTATPDAGWVFDGWSGDVSGMTNPVTVTMTANTSVTATFDEEHRVLLPLVLRESP